MAVTQAEVAERIRGQLKQQLPKDVAIGEVTDETPLITGGLLDSVAALKIIDHLEGAYGIEFDPEELTAELLDTVTLMAALVLKKLGAA